MPSIQTNFKSCLQQLKSQIPPQNHWHLLHLCNQNNPFPEFLHHAWFAQPTGNLCNVLRKIWPWRLLATTPFRKITNTTWTSFSGTPVSAATNDANYQQSAVIKDSNYNIIMKQTPHHFIVISMAMWINLPYQREHHNPLWSYLHTSGVI